MGSLARACVLVVWCFVAGGALLAGPLAGSLASLRVCPFAALQHAVWLVFVACLVCARARGCLFARVRACCFVLARVGPVLGGFL